jgi:hypothetical protein
MLGVFNAGMNIRWDYFVNQYDAARYVSSADGRDNRHIQFVREFASVVSILQGNAMKGVYFEGEERVGASFVEIDRGSIPFSRRFVLIHTIILYLIVHYIFPPRGDFPYSMFICHRHSFIPMYVLILMTKSRSFISILSRQRK